MKRKLKPLHVILAENPDYKITCHNNITMGEHCILSICIKYFGQEISEEVFERYEDTWHESWFEEIKEPERWYLWVHENEHGEPMVNRHLQKESIVDSDSHVERLTLDHIENGYVPIKERK